MRPAASATVLLGLPGEFDGQTVGDLNDSGTVDFEDFLILARFLRDNGRAFHGWRHRW